MASHIETPEHLELPPLPGESKEKFINQPHLSDQRPNRPIRIIFDFDETLTTQDTIDLLARAACQNNHPDHGDQCPTWQQILQKYGEDAQLFEQQWNGQHIGKYMRTSVDLELKYQQEKDVVEQASMERIGKSHMFKGLTHDQIKAAAEFYIATGELQLREGLRDLVDAVNARHKESCIGVVSVNWSKEFIWEVMKLSGYGQVATMANSIDPVDGLIWGSDGQITPAVRIPLEKHVQNRLQVAQDKLWAMWSLIRNGLKADYRDTAGNHHTLVYIGDSLTDLACMQHVDVPIIMLKKTNMLRDFKRMGVKFYHISSYSRSISGLTTESSGNRGGKVYWANNFAEIAQTELFLSPNEMAAYFEPGTEIPIKDWYKEIDRHYEAVFSQAEHNEEMERQIQLQAEMETEKQTLLEKEQERAYREGRAQCPTGHPVKRTAYQQQNGDEHLEGEFGEFKEQHRISETERQKRLQETEVALTNLKAKGDAMTDNERKMLQLYEQMNTEDHADFNDNASYESYDSPAEAEDIWQPMAMSQSIATQVALSQIARDKAQKKEAEQRLFGEGVQDEPLMSGAFDEADEGMKYIIMDTAGDNVGDIISLVEDDRIHSHNSNAYSYAEIPRAKTYATNRLGTVMEDTIDLTTDDQNDETTSHVQETDRSVRASHPDYISRSEEDTTMQGPEDINTDDKDEASVEEGSEDQDFVMAKESMGNVTDNNKANNSRQIQGGW